MSAAGQVVGAFAASHSPGITGWPGRAGRDPRSRRGRRPRGTDRSSRTGRAGRRSVEHFTNFYLATCPAFAIATGAAPTWVR